MLCRFHHRLLHEDGYGIQRQGEGRLELRRPDGSIVPRAPVDGAQGHGADATKEGLAPTIAAFAPH